MLNKTLDWLDQRFPFDADSRYWRFHFYLTLVIVALGVIVIQNYEWISIPLRFASGALFAMLGGVIVHLFLSRQFGAKLIRQAEFKEGTDTPEEVRYSFAQAFGILERLLYVSLIWAGVPHWIGGWLAFKVIAKWQQPENMSDKWKVTRPHNLSLVAELLNIFVGFAGAVIAKGSLTLLLAALKIDVSL